MALNADERRSKLRKAAERSKRPLTRGSLNGATFMGQPMSLIQAATGRSETSQYPEEKKS